MVELGFFRQAILRETSKNVQLSGIRILGGGCINSSTKLETSIGNFFIKYNDQEYLEMFQKEASALKVLSQTETILVPKVFGAGTASDQSYLLLEYLEPAHADEHYWSTLGESLARLHEVPQETFGLYEDNFIGRLGQSNQNCDSWRDFFIQERLLVQFDLLEKEQGIDQSFKRDFEQFLTRLESLMPESEPSLLHGDLWNGNVMSCTKGAVFFDPAIYKGAREMDLAMTELFGGFDRAFYDAYNQANPLPTSYYELVDVYTLYPLMVHVNLFGKNSGYLSSVKRIIARYL